MGQIKKPACTDKEIVYSPLTHVEDVISILNKISISGGLSKDQLYSVLKLLQKVSYSNNECIFKEGEEPGHIYIIRKGKVKIVHSTDEGSMQLAEFSVGQVLGEASVIGIQPHSASALATEDTELIVLSREAYLSIFDSDKELFGILTLNIAREVCRRLHHTDETLLHYVLKNNSRK